MAFLTPTNATESGSPKAIAQKVKAWLESVDALLVGEGRLCTGDFVEQLKQQQATAIASLQAEGWGITRKRDDTFQVIPPQHL